MTRFARACAIALACLLPAAASAQKTASTPSCKDAPLPFAASPANRLTGAALMQTISDKRLTYIRESIRTPGVWVNNMRDHRADGSFVYICEYGRAQEGPFRPCNSFGSQEKRVAGARDVGVWSIKNEAVCAIKSGFGAHTEDCIAIHRQGAVFAAVRMSGPRAVCINGAITLK